MESPGTSRVHRFSTKAQVSQGFPESCTTSTILVQTDFASLSRLGVLEGAEVKRGTETADRICIGPRKSYQETSYIL